MIERFDPLKGERLRVLDDVGRAAPDLDPGLSDADLRALYERMGFGEEWFETAGA